MSDQTIITGLAREMGMEPEADGAEAYAPRHNGHARHMVEQVEQQRPMPKLAVELASRLMDEATITCDEVAETGDLLRTVAAQMRLEGQQIGDHLIDYDRRRVMQREFITGIRAYMAETNMLRR